MIEGAARLIVPGNDETLGLEPRAAQTKGFGTGTPNGIRTRAATLRGWCPRPLDDGGLMKLCTAPAGTLPAEVPV